MKVWQRTQHWFSGIVLAGVVSGCGASQTPVATSVPANAERVQVVATDWKWTLSRTTFKAGRPIDFIVKSDTSTHGFSLVGTSISRTISQGETPVNIVWTPSSSGQYTIKCNVYCGGGHQNMFTSFTVGS